MHKRSDKNSPVDTILYEVDMLRHCAANIGKSRRQRDSSDFDRAEYYLCIEGFLLHLRNLLAFFTNRRDKSSDLIINDPDQWAGRRVAKREFSGLIKAAKEVNNKHGIKESSCYVEISKFMQHCTTDRHERAKEWDIEQMFADIEPVLNEFEKLFAPVKEQMVTRVLDGKAHSTATFRIISAPTAPDEQ
jgi:hypothetical protein